MLYNITAERGIDILTAINIFKYQTLTVQYLSDFSFGKLFSLRSW